MKKYLLICLAAALFSCTENERARHFGGTEEVELPANCKLLGISWKETDLWVAYQDTITGIAYCKEKSTYGILEGNIIIHSKKTESIKDFPDDWGFVTKQK